MPMIVLDAPEPQSPKSDHGNVPSAPSIEDFRPPQEDIKEEKVQYASSRNLPPAQPALSAAPPASSGNGANEPLFQVIDPEAPINYQNSHPAVHSLRSMWATKSSEVVHFRGNDTNEHNAFKHDLLLEEGETILAEFSVLLKKPPRPRLIIPAGAIAALFFILITWIVSLIIVLLMSVYYIIRFFNRLYGFKAKMVVTSHGRVLVWRTQADGVRKSLCCPLHLGSQTVFTEFNIANLAFVDRYYSREEGLVKACCGVERLSSLHLFFDEYPTIESSFNKASIGGYSDAQDLASEIADSMESPSGLVELLFSYGKAVFKIVKQAFSSISLDAVLYGKYDGLSDDHVLFVESAETEFYKDQDPVYDWNGLLALDKAITEQRLKMCTKTFNIKAAEESDDKPDEKNEDFTWAEGDCNDLEMRNLIPNKTHSVVYKSDFGISDDEEILATCPLSYSMTLIDIIMSVLTLGIWYFLVVAKYDAIKSSIILTDKRVMFVSIHSSKGIFRPDLKTGPDFGIKISSWYFNEVQLGVVMRGQNAVEGKFLTDYGGLNFVLSEPHFWDCFGTMDRKTKYRFAKFLNKIMQICNGRQVLDGPELVLENGKDYVINNRYHPSSTEKALAVFESKNSNTCWQNFVEAISCGFYPVRARSELLITSERAWMCVREVTKRTCIMRDPNEITICAPLESVMGGRVISVASHCDPAICQDPIEADASLQLAVKEYGFPLYTWRSADNAKGGLMEDDAVISFRKMVALITLANSIGKILDVSKPYGKKEEPQYPPKYEAEA